MSIKMSGHSSICPKTMTKIDRSFTWNICAKLSHYPWLQTKLVNPIKHNACGIHKVRMNSHS